MSIPMNRFLKYAVAAAFLLGAVQSPPVWANSAPPEENATPKITLVTLNPLMVPVLKGSRVVKYMTVNIDLEPAPEVDADAVTHHLPRVYDALLREAYLFAQENQDTDEVDLEILRTRLLPVINSALGDKKIIGLFFTGAITVRA